MYRGMWEQAMDDVIANLTRIVNGITVVGQQVVYKSAILLSANFALDLYRISHPILCVSQSNGYFLSTYEHLGCWLPGGLALGAMSGAVKGSKAAWFLELAANMTRTCYITYQLSPTGTTSLYSLLIFNPEFATQSALFSKISCSQTVWDQPQFLFHLFGAEVIRVIRVLQAWGQTRGRSRQTATLWPRTDGRRCGRRPSRRSSTCGGRRTT